MKTGSVLVLNSSRFGQGNPRLGESLMNDFLAGAADSPLCPAAVILYNTAVVLACKDSVVLSMLQAMEEKGVSVLVNSESLDFYSLTEQLEAGKPCSMAEMTDILFEAETVIKP